MVSLLLAETKRSLLYLKNILINKIEINNILYFTKKKDKTFKYLRSKNLLSKKNSKLIYDNLSHTNA